MLNQSIPVIDPTFAELVSEYNDCINNFITNNPKNVKYDEHNDGTYTITLYYAISKDIKLKELAKNLQETYNENKFKIYITNPDTNEKIILPCEIIKSDENIIVFQGKTERLREILSEYKSLIDHPIINSSKINYELYDNMNILIYDFIIKYVRHKLDYSKSFLDEIGLIYQNTSSTGHLKIDVKQLYASRKMHTEYVSIFEPLIKVAKNNPKYIVDILSKQLEKYKITIERVDENYIMFHYDLYKYDQEIIEQNWGYIPVPGLIQKIYIHLNGQFEKLSNQDVALESPYNENINEDNPFNPETTYKDIDGSWRSFYGKFVRMRNSDVICIDCNITAENTVSDICNIILNNEKFIDEITNKKRYATYNPNTGDWIGIKKEEIPELFRDKGIHLSDSKLTFTSGYYEDENYITYSKDSIFGGYSADDTATFGWFLSNYRYLVVDDYRNINQIPCMVIAALQTGRALDICIPYPPSHDVWYKCDRIRYLQSK